MGRLLAIDGFGHHETPAIVRVNQPTFGVLNAGLTAHRDKKGIVEFFRPGDVVTPDHNMAEHSILSSSESHVACRLRPTSSTRCTGWGQYAAAMIGKREKSLSPSPSPAACDSWVMPSPIRSKITSCTNAEAIVNPTTEARKVYLTPNWPASQPVSGIMIAEATI